MSKQADVVKLWDDYWPIREIARKTGVNRNEVKAMLDDLYSKNEAHYRATAWRDRQKIDTLETWFEQNFDTKELQISINQGKFNDYLLNVYRQTKVSVPTIRHFLINKLGKLPTRQKSETYVIRGASKFRGREDELVAMRKQGMSVRAIHVHTGVHTETIRKVLKSRNIDTTKRPKRQKKIKRLKQVKQVDKSVIPPTEPISKQQGIQQVNQLLDSLNVRYFLLSADDDFDFYLPMQNVGINVAPLDSGATNEYAEKHAHAEAMDVELITLFNKELHEPWWSSFSVPLIKIKALGHAEHTYYARQTIIKPINKQQAKMFLDQWHLNGYQPAKFAYGVFNRQNELLGVATFGMPQTPKYKELGLLELKRLGWRADVQVRYGISKIMAYAAKQHRDEFKGILTFSDNNMGNGLGYQKAGFELIKHTKPQLHFVNPNHPQDQYSWSVATSWSAKGGVLARAFGSQTLTNKQAYCLVETELPHRSDNGKGYLVQYDCGNKVWVKWF